MRRIIGRLREAGGPTAIEYGLLAAVIAVAAIGVIDRIGATLAATVSMAATGLA